MKPKLLGMLVKAFHNWAKFILQPHLPSPFPPKLQPNWPPLCYLNTHTAYSFRCLRLSLGELLFILQNLAQGLPWWRSG